MRLKPLKCLKTVKPRVSPRLRFAAKIGRNRCAPFRLRFVSFRFVSPRRPAWAPRPYSTGAGLTANGPSAGAALLSSRGLSAPVTRPVSETQPAGADTVGPRPGPATT